MPGNSSMAGRGERRQADRLRRQDAYWSGKASPVTTVQATRCECGAWIRPGVDHTCEANG